MKENSTTPVKASERIIVLDVLRGFALVGIVLANIFSWSGIRFLPFSEIKALGFLDSDIFLYNLMMIFIDTKFYTIFSLLFGIGFSIQFSKNKNVQGFIPLYMRRLTILFFIGLVHGLIWSGDILMLYAVMGFILILFRNLPTKRLLPMSIIFLLIPLLSDLVFMHTLEPSSVVVEKTALKMYPDWTPEQVVEGFKSDNLIDNFETNFHNLKWRWYDFIPSGRPFKILALFLLGFYLYQIKFFSKHALNIKYLLLFLLIGITGTLLAKQLTGSMSAFSANWENFFYKVLHEIGQVPLALAYICILTQLVTKFPKLKVWDGLKNYGRMSLTSYVGHTVLGILIFYPVAFNYFGEVSLTMLYVIVVPGILITQITYATVWFKYFRFGPVEWVWRCLTYKKLFPLRKERP